jgi:hypothetical protein
LLGQKRLEATLNEAGNKMDVLCLAEIEVAVARTINGGSFNFVSINP